MGQLAFVGSHSINGVSALHTGLMKQSVFSKLNQLYPGSHQQQDQWRYAAPLVEGRKPSTWQHLLRDAVGKDIFAETEHLKEALPLAKDSNFQDTFKRIKHDNKAALSNLVKARMDLSIDPDSMFDVQIKRIHEYKRQLLNILETIALYNDMRAHPEKTWAPRVKIFAGKAAASYHMAKLTIKLINDVAQVVNNDTTLRGALKVAFIPNYNVSLAEVIVPAADLSEQISTAGLEASGTGNMKLALNGALTIGTMDGANVEMLEHIGADNIFIFGLLADEVEARRAKGINGHEVVAASQSLARRCECIAWQAPSPMATMIAINRSLTRFWAMTGSWSHQTLMLIASAQNDVSKLWGQKKRWTEKAIINSVSMGWFSSDRTIRDYARDIWQLPVN